MNGTLLLRNEDDIKLVIQIANYLYYEYGSDIEVKYQESSKSKVSSINCFSSEVQKDTRLMSMLKRLYTSFKLEVPTLDRVYVSASNIPYNTKNCEPLFGMFPIFFSMDEGSVDFMILSIEDNIANALRASSKVNIDASVLKNYLCVDMMRGSKINYICVGSEDGERIYYYYKYLLYKNKRDGHGSYTSGNAKDEMDRSVELWLSSISDFLEKVKTPIDNVHIFSFHEVYGSDVHKVLQFQRKGAKGVELVVY